MRYAISATIAHGVDRAIRAGNAFSASAAVFDALSEIDNKFAKVADKECEALSTEVRKWFKKLAVSVFSQSWCTVSLTFLAQKEEKAHDERMMASNVKIKQAGIRNACYKWLRTDR